MAIAFDVFDVCDQEKAVEAIEHREGFEYLRDEFKNYEKIIRKAIHLHPENEQFINTSTFTLHFD